MTHLKIYAVVLAGLLLFLLGAGLDSWIRGGNFSPDRLKAVSVFLTSPDPAMNTSARYIRHLSLTYPGSPFPDFPGQPDYLPAGMAWAPPHFPGITTTLGTGGKGEGQKEPSP